MERSNIILTALSLKGIGKKKARTLLDGFLDEIRDTKDFQELVRSRWESLRVKVPFSESLFDDAIEKAGGIIEKSENLNIRILPFDDPYFPARLRNIPDPPIVLFMKGGKIDFEGKKSVAIIGTRKPSQWGYKVGVRLGEYFGKNEFHVVSGLALGCDTAAHQGCLNSDGLAIGVMAHGLERVYPASNKGLAASILEGGGALVSEYPVGTAPHKTNFVDRDRLQSGLSDAVIVIETAVKGGTMHTVKFAERQKRLLACLQHPKEKMTETSTGNEMLIRDKRAVGLKNGEDLAKFRSLSSDFHEQLSRWIGNGKGFGHLETAYSSSVYKNFVDFFHNQQITNEGADEAGTQLTLFT